MLALTAQQTRQLAALLGDAEAHTRHLAAEHGYRAKACKSIGERLLAVYHQQHAEGLHQDADRLRESADWLLAQPQPTHLRATA